MTTLQIHLKKAAEDICHELEWRDTHEQETYAELVMSYTFSGVNEPSAWAQAAMNEAPASSHNQYELETALEHLKRMYDALEPLHGTSMWGQPLGPVHSCDRDPNESWESFF